MKITLDVSWHDIVRIVEDEGYLLVPREVVAEMVALRLEKDKDKLLEQ